MRKAVTPMPPVGSPAPAGAPFDSGVPALVLRLDRNPFHHGTLGAVRTLGRAGVEVHAVVESAASPVTRSRHLRAAHPVPGLLPAAGPAGAAGRGGRGAIGPEETVTLLRRVSERIGRPAVLIAMDDLSAVHTAEAAGRLGDRFLLPAQPPGLPGLLADKAALAAVCAAADIPHPAGLLIAGADDVPGAVRRLGLPLVAKWSRPWLLPAATGLRSTTVVRTPAAVRALCARAGAAGSALLLQRYLPDGPDTDWFFHGCFGGGADPVLLAGGSGRKELSWPPRAGLTAKGRWEHRPELAAAALRLVSHVGYRGILDLDFRRDRATGVLQLLDANPRPGAQFRLFAGSGGAPGGGGPELDVVRALYLDLTGRPVPAHAARPGRVFVAENYALLSALASVRGRGPAVWRRALRAPVPGGGRPGTETAWYAADDPGPFLAMARAWVARGTAKAADRLRPAPTGPSSGPLPVAVPVPSGPGPGPGPAAGAGAGAGPVPHASVPAPATADVAARPR
ncbi:ATP-grasp domain-containing protein [Streptomyces sp. NPDC000594]|uniref:ATP-grasp domain-containing protein n=1 Tax=Streptomyces sp. NPDC000594 TaxID=3154261 RepID=UPI0033169744